MKTKFMFAAAGGIAAAAVAIFLIFVMGPSGIMSLAGQGGNNPNSANASNTSYTASDLGVSLKYVNVTKVDDRNARIKVAFAIHNPNSVAILLEDVHYTVKVDDHQMTLGDTGEPLEGFLASQASSTLVVSYGNATVTDTENSVRNNLVASAWDKMANGTASYAIDGFYSFRATQGLQTSYLEKPFNLTYH